MRKWAEATRKKQKGGFLSLIIAGLVALGVSSANAALAASVAAPIIWGALVASGGVIVNKIAGGGKKKEPNVAVIKQFLDKKVKQALSTGSISGGRIRPPLRIRSRMSRR